MKFPTSKNYIISLKVLIIIITINSVFLFQHLYGQNQLQCREILIEAVQLEIERPEIFDSMSGLLDSLIKESSISEEEEKKLRQSFDTNNSLFHPHTSYDLATKQMSLISSLFKSNFNDRDISVSFQKTIDSEIVLFFFVQTNKAVTRDIPLKSGQEIHFIFSNGEKIISEFQGTPLGQSGSMLSSIVINAIKLDSKLEEYFLNSYLNEVLLIRPFTDSKSKKDYPIVLGDNKKKKLRKYINCLNE